MKSYTVFLTVFRFLISSLLLQQCCATPIAHQTLFSSGAPRVSHGKNKYVLPVFDANYMARVQEIINNREGYQYSAPLLGNTSYFAGGVLGEAMVERDKQLWFRDVQYISDNVNNIEWPQAAKALAEAGGLQNLSSYAVIYENQWKNTILDGVSPRVLTNWTQDLLFSMERLSITPYVVHRLNPASDDLPFLIKDHTVQQIAGGLTLDELLSEGRLFFGNHSIQKKYPTNPGRWTAACSAYFYIHPESSDFLPLAIRTNVGADIVYTPLDDENDWLFAKMAFEMNDLFHGQIYHLSNTIFIQMLIVYCDISDKNCG